MDEYISREDVLKKAKSSISVPTDNEWDCGYNTAMAEMQEFIKHLPSADVQHMKHGRWTDCTFYDPYEKSWEQNYEFKCSNCGHKIYNKPNDDNLFCGHCSAKMDLKDGEKE